MGSSADILTGHTGCGGGSGGLFEKPQPHQTCPGTADTEYKVQDQYVPGHHSEGRLPSWKQLYVCTFRGGTGTVI